MEDIEVIVKMPQFIYKHILKCHVTKKTISKIFSNSTSLEKHDEEVIKETVESIWGKPCADAVSRQAINNLRRYRYNCGETSVVCVSLASINELPPVNPQNTDLLDKIRREIKYHSEHFINDNGEDSFAIYEDDVLEIIDKYIKEIRNES